MSQTILASALVAVLLLGGCDSLGVGDLNNPGLESLEENPTPSAIAAASTGLLLGTRSGIAAQNGYISLLGILGRESYNFDPADPRFISEMLVLGLNPGSPAFGGNLFGTPYANIRNGNIIVHALEKVPGMTDGEKEAVRGFVQTIQALDFLQVANTRDVNGAPIDVDRDPTAEPAPIVSKAEVFAHITQLLDEAVGHLAAAQAAGASFPFPLTSGFAGFDTPATFVKFNRALRTRVAVYTGDFAKALAILNSDSTFLSTAAPLTLGAYHVFSTNAGDSTNTLFDPNGRAIWAHPSILTQAQRRADNSPDLRVMVKVRIVPVKVVQGITDSLLFTIYGSTSAPVPIIRNEELVLLRAEARLGSGDIPGAVQDIDFIRTTSGGLPAYAGPQTPDAVLSELLYNKRYSLLFEGGHSWLDYRRYGKLAELPRDLPEHRFFPKFPFPNNECLAQATPPATGCTTEAGF